MLRNLIIKQNILETCSIEYGRFLATAARGKDALRKLVWNIQWVENAASEDKTFCAYLTEDGAVIQRHAEISGFPAVKIMTAQQVADSTAANDAS